MKAAFSILGVEIATLTLESEEPTTVAEVVETKLDRAVDRALNHPAVSRVIGRISTAWVAAGMRR